MSKDVLKQQGCRWDDGSRVGCKGWWICVPQDCEKEEMAFLADDIYPGGNTNIVEITRVDAFARFFAREPQKGDSG